MVLDSHMPKNKHLSILTPTTKIKSRDYRPNCQMQYFKTYRRKYVNQAEFLDITPKAQTMKLIN